MWFHTYSLVNCIRGFYDWKNHEIKYQQISFKLLLKQQFKSTKLNSNKTAVYGKTTKFNALKYL